MREQSCTNVGPQSMRYSHSTIVSLQNRRRSGQTAGNISVMKAWDELLPQFMDQWASGIREMRSLCYIDRVSKYDYCRAMDGF
jgi:hypothetical protein